MRVLAGSLVALALGALVVTGRAHTRSEQSLKVERTIYSPAVAGRLRLAVYLPAGYSSSGGRRYPVVYFLHGLPATPSSYRGADFLARALAASGRRAIIVAPQGARDNDSDPEYLDWGAGRNWETAITRDVVTYVDSHLRTIRGRRGRAIVGLSAGGYGAVILALHHLPAFSVVESWSGYFHPTDPAGDRALDLGTARANAKANAHAFVKTLRGGVAKKPTFFALYVGMSETRFREGDRVVRPELTSGGVADPVLVYPGGH